MQPAGDFYPIVSIQAGWVLEDEAMGSKRKFWFRESGDGADWLFKYPQPNTGQHWAEKLAA
ncbi:MAG: HipA-like protein, partial [Acidobacteriota bacterium]